LLKECEAKRSGKIDEEIIKELTVELKMSEKKQIAFDVDDIK